MSVLWILYAVTGVGLGAVADKILQEKSVGLLANLVLGAFGAVGGAWSVGTLNIMFMDDRQTITIVAAVACSLFALFLGFLFKRY